MKKLRVGGEPTDSELYPDELLDAVRHAWASDRRALAVIDVVRAYDDRNERNQ